MKQGRLFYNHENDEIVTMPELIKYYNDYLDEIDCTWEEFTLIDYVNACTGKNGSLDEINDKYYLDYANNEIISIWALYDYYRNYESHDSRFNDFTENGIYSNGSLLEIPSNRNKYDITPIKFIEHIITKHGFDCIGAAEIILQLIDDDLFYDLDFEQLDRIIIDYKDR